MNSFQAVSHVFRTTALMLAAAHACANVYERSNGNPDVTWDHTDPNFRLNVPGVVAADSAANIIAKSRHGVDADGNVSEEAHVEALKALAEWDLSESEAYDAENVANATWRTAVYGRPEERWGRPVNQSFNLLPLSEKAKDKDQLMAAAAYFLTQIEALK